MIYDGYDKDSPKLKFLDAARSTRNFFLAKHIDPEYDRLLKKAVFEGGVEAIAVKVKIRENGLYFDSEIDLRFW